MALPNSFLTIAIIGTVVFLLLFSNKVLKFLGFSSAPVPEKAENIILFLSGVFFVLLFVAPSTTLDGQIRAVFNDPSIAMSSLGHFDGDTSNELVFNQNQINNINWASQGSFGYDPVADERLFCFSEDEGVVTDIQLVHNITLSKMEAVSGECSTLDGGKVDGFLHTHPDHSDQMSKEDKDVEGSGIKYMCLAWDEVATITDETVNMKCFTTDNFENPIEVGIQKGDL